MKGYANKTEKIGDHQIITGLKPLAIDPRATQSACAVLIYGTDAEGDGNDGIKELKPLRKKQEQSNRLLQEIAQAKTHGKKLAEQSEKQKKELRSIMDQRELANRNSEHKVTLSALKEQERIYNLKKANFEQCQTELKPLISDFNQTAKEILRENPVYCEPNQGEYVDPETLFMGGTAAELDAQERELQDQDGNKIKHPDISVPNFDELIQKWMSKSDNEQVTISGEVLEDFRGKQYFYKADGIWIESEVISQLGVTKNTVVVEKYQDQAVEKYELTPEQLEEIRVQNLSAEEKTAEKENAIDDAATQAATMRSKLEIQGATATKAKTDAQAWYSEQLTLIEAKYA
jgi:hypothetical protein